MDDATFLKQCGIEVDMRWLAEITSQNEPTEVSNYATSLLRIADIFNPNSLVKLVKSIPGGFLFGFGSVDGIFNSKLYSVSWIQSSLPRMLSPGQLSIGAIPQSAPNGAV